MFLGFPLIDVTRRETGPAQSSRKDLCSFLILICLFPYLEMQVCFLGKCKTLLEKEQSDISLINLLFTRFLPKTLRLLPWCVEKTLYLFLYYKTIIIYPLYRKANPNALETNWNAYLCFNRPFYLMWCDLAQTLLKNRTHKIFQK